MPQLDDSSFKLSLGYLSGGGSTSSGNQGSSFSQPTPVKERLQNLTAPVADFLGGVGNRARGFVPLGSNAEEVEEPSLFGSLSWSQRMIGFALCSLAALTCFTISFFTLPLLPIRPQKFAVLFTFGSILFMSAFALLRGPMAQLRHLFSRERWLFTAGYFSSMILTLVASLKYRSYIGTVIASLVQVIAVIWYFVSYIPGGSSSLRMGTRALGRGILPI